MKKGYLVTLIICVMVMAGAYNANAYKGGAGGGCPMMSVQGGRYGLQLDEATMAKLDKEQESFFKKTQDLKNEIYAKNLELEAEIAKKNPNMNTVKKVQRELSKLKADFDEKMIEHRINMNKIAPGYGSRMMMRGKGMMMQGKGMMMHGKGMMMKNMKRSGGTGQNMR
jgi:zinc resistance-associated protein